MDTYRELDANTREPDEANNAWAILAEHQQHSITGLCGKCGRPWDRIELCGAPEVDWARRVTRTGHLRPDFRVSGANARTFAYGDL